MNPNVRFEEEADAEYRLAGRWYEDQRENLGIEFFDAIPRRLSRDTRSHPNIGHRPRSAQTRLLEDAIDVARAGISHDRAFHPVNASAHLRPPVECMFTWYWVADLCAAEGIPFVLGHALAMKAIHGGKAKNDRIDSHKIAVLLRGGMLPQAYVYPAAMRSTRDLIGRR